MPAWEHELLVAGLRQELQVHHHDPDVETAEASMSAPARDPWSAVPDAVKGL